MLTLEEKRNIDLDAERRKVSRLARQRDCLSAAVDALRGENARLVGIVWRLLYQEKNEVFEDGGGI